MTSQKKETAHGGMALRHRLTASAVALLLALLGLGLWALWEPWTLVVREYELVLPDWPRERSGLRVALLADVHTGSPGNGTDKLAEIVRQTNQQSPDLVLILGDLVIQGVKGGQFVSPEVQAASLGALTAPLGVYAVLGNHDWWHDGPAVRAALEGAGIPCLDEQVRDLGGLWLAGLGDFWEGNPDVPGTLGKVPAGAPVLAFTHNPDIFVQIPPSVVLTVAGHTHGGQVYLPVVGRPVVPSTYGQRFAAGHVVEDGRHLFVSTGLGTSILPVRFRVPPEITILRILSGAGG